jgi:hypothetical protein
MLLALGRVSTLSRGWEKREDPIRNTALSTSAGMDSQPAV